jgi:hypothetical protein
LFESLSDDSGCCRKGAHPVVAIYGEAGCGKTECVLRLASAKSVTDNVAKVQRISLVVACFTSMLLYSDKFGLRPNPAVPGGGSEAEQREARSRAVLEAITGVLEKKLIVRSMKNGVSEETRVPWEDQREWKKAPKNNAGNGITLVVFIDEAGTHPLFVRALCDAAYGGDLEEKLCERFGVHMVRFVVAGTGCDDANISPGAHPSSYITMQPTAKTAWEALSKDRTVAQWNDNRFKGDSVIAAMCNELVANARFAALLAERLRPRDYPETGDWRWLLLQHLIFAASEFKVLSALKGSPNDEYTHVVLRSFLMSRNTDKTLGDFRELHSASRRWLSCVLVDQIQAERRDAPAGTASLNVPANGRYEFGRHHLLMQRLTVDGIAFPGTSWTAFAMLTSDAMLNVARMLGDEDLRNEARNVDPNVDGKASGWDPDVKPEPLTQWVGEIAMIKWMADKVHEVCTVNKLGVPNLAVCRSFSKTRVGQKKPTLKKFLSLFPDEQDVQRHHVVLNGNLAPGPDVMVGVRLSHGKFVFFFAQCKCDSAGTELNPEEVANELRKLGFKTQATSASERRQSTTTRPPKRAKGFTSRSGNPNLTDGESHFTTTFERACCPGK